MRIRTNNNFILYRYRPAENVAKSFKISRQEQDEYAAESQRRTQVAIAGGYFKNEIVPVVVPGRKESVTVSSDEFPKPATTVEGLAKLRPVFVKVNIAKLYAISESLARGMSIKMSQ